MSEMTIEQEPVVESASAATSDEQLIAMLVDRARSEGLQLTGDGGLLQQLTKRVLESALEGEITDHVGYEKHDPAGKNNGDSRNGTRAKTVAESPCAGGAKHHPVQHGWVVRRSRNHDHHGVARTLRPSPWPGKCLVRRLLLA